MEYSVGPDLKCESYLQCHQKEFLKLAGEGRTVNTVTAPGGMFSCDIDIYLVNWR